MDAAHIESSDQAKLWNGAAGRGWVEMQDLLDTMFRPMENMLVDAASNASAQRVLDVGCGTGSTTLAIAQRLEAGGSCVGIDISRPMIAAAELRAARTRSTARFVCDDAQKHAFATGSFDMVVSRFGVMFFDDPVAAFANLRRASTEHAKLCFLAWRSAEENPFMTAGERAAAGLLRGLPVRRPDEPGQFAFASGERIRHLLEAGGWGAIELTAVDIACSFAEKDLTRYLTHLGPVGRALQDADAATRRNVIDTVRAALDPYVEAGAVHFDAACWRVEARARPLAMPV